MKKNIFSFIGIAAILTVIGIIFINAGKKDESKEIISLLENERATYCDNDFNAYQKNWVKSDEVLFMVAGMDFHYSGQGWDNISKDMQNHMKWKIENNVKTVEDPEDFKYNSIIVEGNMAWVNITQFEKNKEVKDQRSYVLKRVGKEWKIFNINLFLFGSYSKEKYVINTEITPEKTHVNLNDFPKDMVFPMIDGWGGMCVDINNAPAGTDFSPLLEGLENDHCQVPHWGYVVKGAIRMDYEDGTSEVFRAGEAFYMKPGHTGGVEEDLLLVSFGPEVGIKQLVKHFENKMAQMSNK